jgi:hypothetical protein
MATLRDRIGITEIPALQAWVRTVVGSHFKVKFDPKAETAYVDSGKNMVIPAPNAAMTLRDAIRLRGFCLHETSHPMYQPRIFDLMQANKTKPHSPLGSVFNLLLDVHCETMRYKQWPGDGKALSEFGAVVGHDIHERLEKMLKVNGNVFPKGFDKMAVVMTAARNAEATWNMGMYVGFAKLVDELFTQEIRDKADELEAKFDLKGRLVNDGDKETEESIWQLAREIYEWLWEKDPEEEMEQPEGGKGKPKDGEEGEEESDGTTGSGKPEYDPDAKSEDTEETLKEKIKVTEMLFSNHYEQNHKGGGHGVGFDYTGYKMRSAYQPIDPHEFKVIDYSKGG